MVASTQNISFAPEKSAFTGKWDFFWNTRKILKRHPSWHHHHHRHRHHHHHHQAFRVCLLFYDCTAQQSVPVVTKWSQNKLVNFRNQTKKATFQILPGLGKSSICLHSTSMVWLIRNARQTQCFTTAVHSVMRYYRLYNAYHIIQAGICLWNVDTECLVSVNRHSR